jgi:disulfide bond formation protein DsbB
MYKNKIWRWEIFCHVMELLGVLSVLGLACIFQFALQEIPCSLCLLQRLGLFGIALGFLMNLRFGFRPSHYAIVILSGIFTALVALRQIALHILPGTQDYGIPLFGLHLYTWSFIIAMIVVVFTTLILGIDRQYFSTTNRLIMNKWWHGLFAISFLLCLLNCAATLAECGFYKCPADPTHYLL